MKGVIRVIKTDPVKFAIGISVAAIVLYPVFFKILLTLASIPVP